jgi:hypothetical protein
MAKHAGQPTKYNAGMIQRVADFVQERVAEQVIPTIPGFAVSVGVCEDTIHEWKHKHKKFSESIRKLLATQCTMLQTLGLSQVYSAPMSIFLLKNNHGFKDRTEQEVTTKALPAPILKVDPSVHRDDSNNQNKPTA